MPSPATWLPRGGGGVEGTGAEEEGQREKDTSLLFFLLVSLLLSSRPPFPSSSSLSSSAWSIQSGFKSGRFYLGVLQGTPASHIWITFPTFCPAAFMSSIKPSSRNKLGSPTEHGSFCSEFEKFQLRGGFSRRVTPYLRSGSGPVTLPIWTLLLNYFQLFWRRRGQTGRPGEAKLTILASSPPPSGPLIEIWRPPAAPAPVTLRMSSARWRGRSTAQWDRGMMGTINRRC